MSPSPARGRFPGSVYGAGEEPDPRFSMANERTFLAWIRTALALSAAGVALEALELPIAHGLRLTSSLVLITLGIVTPVLSWVAWASTERALRLGHPLPSSLLGPVLAVGTAIAAALVLTGLLLE